jgi:hypothetical protein
MGLQLLEHVRGLDFITRVAAVHLRQTILKLMGRQGGRA